MVKYGLADWRITFDDGGKNEEKFATVRYDCKTRHAHFDFYWGAETTLSLERCAAHEVIHVHVADLLDVGCRIGYSHHDQVIQEEHRMIERELILVMGMP